MSAASKLVETARREPLGISFTLLTISMPCPGLPVSRPQASAACTAAASCRVCTRSIEVPIAASNSDMMWLPDSVKIVSCPARSRVRMTMSAPRRGWGMRGLAPLLWSAVYRRWRTAQISSTDDARRVGRQASSCSESLILRGCTGLGGKRLACSGGANCCWYIYRKVRRDAEISEKKYLIRARWAVRGTLCDRSALPPSPNSAKVRSSINPSLHC